MAFTSYELQHMSQKLIAGILPTANISPGIKYWFNENFPLLNPIPGGKVWIDTVPGASNIATADANVAAYPSILEKRKVRLTQDVTSGGRTYEARSVFGDNTSSMYENWILPPMSMINGGPSTGYSIRLYNGDPDSGGTLISETYGADSNFPGWFFSYGMGVIVCATAQSSNFSGWYSTNGLYIVGYRYIGRTAGGDSPSYNSTFTIGEWVGPAGGFYTRSFIHNLNKSLLEVEVWDASNVPVDVERLLTSVNETTLRVPADPDLRFSGMIWIKTT